MAGDGVLPRTGGMRAGGRGSQHVSQFMVTQHCLNRVARVPGSTRHMLFPGAAAVGGRSWRTVCHAKNPFEGGKNPLGNLFGGAKKEDGPARKAPEGKKPSGLDAYYKQAKQRGSQEPKQTSGGGGFGGIFGGGGGGGGGGWNWGGEEGAGDSGPEKPIGQELRELARGIWVLLTNAALFLLVADVLHHSLDWCCQVELLLLVGAPTQAFERVAGRFYAVVEWVERHLLGWKVPSDEDNIPMYENLALYYPVEHAYTFDAYRYNVNSAEKTTLRNFHALRWWERDGGFAGDVKEQEVQAIVDKYDPNEVDLREFRAAKAQGRLNDYWAARGDKLEAITGSREPPV